MARPPAPEASYTARRAHAARNIMPPPSTHRWRVSFGACGNVLSFGSRNPTLVDLSTLDSLDDPEESAASRTRMEAALRVHVANNAGRNPVLKDVLRGYKDAAAAPDADVPQHALAEQHAWKLVAALFLPLDEGLARDEGSGHDEGADATARAARRMEALKAWLRGALWDAAALERAAATDRGDEAAALWPLLGAAASEEAARASLEDARAYLAAILAQPGASVASDLAEQLQAWASEPSEMVPQKLRELYELLAGRRPSEPARAAADGGWMQPYALSLPAATLSTDVMPPPPPLAEADGTPPADPSWHLLRLAAGRTAADDVALKPVPVAAGARHASGPSPHATVRLGDYSFAWHLARVVGRELGTAGTAPTVHAAFAQQLEASWAAFVEAHLSSAPFDDTLGLSWHDVGPSGGSQPLANEALATLLLERRRANAPHAAAHAAAHAAPHGAAPVVQVTPDELRRCAVDVAALRPSHYVEVAAVGVGGGGGGGTTRLAPVADAALLHLLARRPLPDEPTPTALALLDLGGASGAPLSLSAAHHLHGSRRAIVAAHATAAVRAAEGGHATLSAQHHLAVVRLARGAPTAQAAREHAWAAALAAVDALLPRALLSSGGMHAPGHSALRALVGALQRTAAECDAEQKWPLSAAAAVAAGATGGGGGAFAAAAAKATALAEREEHLFGRWSDATLAALAAFSG